VSLHHNLSEPSPIPAPTSQVDPRRWWILIAVTVAQLMVVLDATVVNIALPSAQRSLQFSTADRQWIVTAYALAFGGLLLLGGRLADLFGRRRILIVGIVGFALASAVGGAATGFVMLATARAVQGAFGALLAPAALSQLTTTFDDPAERGKAFGIYGAIAGAGGAVGLILGGALTQYLDWRWCMYINDVIGVVALVLTLVFVPRSESEPGVQIDWPGVLTVGAGLVAIVYGFSEADTRSWSSPITIILLVAGVVLIGTFLAIERRSAHPLLPLSVLANRNRSAANLVILVSGVGMFGVFLFLTYYVQLTLGFSPLMSGIAFLPMLAILVLVSAVGTARILPRFGPRGMVTVGMALAAGGLAIFAQLGVGSTYGSLVVPGLLVTGAGLGLVFGAAMSVATADTGANDAGVASALPNIGQQVGGAVGTALLNTLAASAAAAYLATHGVSKAAQGAAAVHGDDVAFWVGAGIFAAGAVIAGLLFNRGVGAPRQAHRTAGAVPTVTPEPSEMFT
jgi:EmrB/QacA subfamily drug resistance transporter